MGIWTWTSHIQTWHQTWLESSEACMNTELSTVYGEESSRFFLIAVAMKCCSGELLDFAMNASRFAKCCGRREVKKSPCTSPSHFSFSKINGEWMTQPDLTWLRLASWTWFFSVLIHHYHYHPDTCNNTDHIHVRCPVRRVSLLQDVVCSEPAKVSKCFSHPCSMTAFLMSISDWWFCLDFKLVLVFSG